MVRARNQNLESTADDFDGEDLNPTLEEAMRVFPTLYIREAINRRIKLEDNHFQMDFSHEH